MSEREAEGRFVELMSAWLVSLPYDLKILFEAVDDENLNRRARELAASAIVYVVSPNDAVADRHDSFMSYCDDCLVLRLAFAKGLGDSEDDEYFRSRFPEFFAPLQQELAVCDQVMGTDLVEWLWSKVDALDKLSYKGKKVATYLDDSEAAALLYEDGLEFSTEYPIEEDLLRDKLKKAATVVDFIRRRRDEEVRGRSA